MSSQTAIYHDNNNHMQKRYSEQVILKVLNAYNNTVAIDNNSNNTIDNNSNNIYTGAKRHFVISNSCFWCASLYSVICNSCFWCASLYSNSRTVKCPVCNRYGNLESIPISKNESFNFNYHSRTGIVLEFS